MTSHVAEAAGRQVKRQVQHEALKAKVNCQKNIKNISYAHTHTHYFACACACVLVQISQALATLVRIFHFYYTIDVAERCAHAHNLLLHIANVTCCCLRRLLFACVYDYAQFMLHADISLLNLKIFQVSAYVCILC